MRHNWGEIILEVVCVCLGTAIGKVVIQGGGVAEVAGYAVGALGGVAITYYFGYRRGAKDQRETSLASVNKRLERAKSDAALLQRRIDNNDELLRLLREWMQWKQQQQ